MAQTIHNKADVYVAGELRWHEAQVIVRGTSLRVKARRDGSGPFEEVFSTTVVLGSSRSRRVGRDTEVEWTTEGDEKVSLVKRSCGCGR